MEDSLAQTLTQEQKDFFFHHWVFNPAGKFYFCFYLPEEIHSPWNCQGCGKRLSEKDYHRLEGWFRAAAFAK